jgi:integrase
MLARSFQECLTMASIVHDPNGKKRIVFTAPDGSRKAVRMGKTSDRTAEKLKHRIEQLLDSIKYSHAWDAELSEWVKGQDLPLVDKLVAVGLVPKEIAKKAEELGKFLSTFMDGRTDLKPATKIVQGQVIRDLKEFFGENREVVSILPGDADDFKQWLLGRKLATSTVQKRLQVAKSFFHAMRRRKLISENPFDGVRAVATGIADRQRFVTREETERVLEACPDLDWKLIVALARYGGVRTPSESLSLRWQDIDWNTNRITVQSPKTEHHPGRSYRTIPLFPELRPLLEQAFEAAPVGAEFVVDARFRKAALGPAGWLNANLRTSFLKIIRRAGLQPWPRMFQNLRASRETELVETYPVQVVTAWLGNTPKVAMRHYLMTTEEHFEDAVNRDQSAARKAAQYTSERAENGQKEQSPETTQAPVLPGLATICGVMQNTKVAGTGFEPVTSRL